MTHMLGCVKHTLVTMICYSMLVNPNVLCVVQKVVLNHAERLHTSPQFYISGNSIEVVDRWPHLGHIIRKNSDDNRDILNRRSSFIAQANDVICTFGKLDCVTKMRLFNLSLIHI